MSRSRGRTAQSVSLFPFLAVLVCAMGALIFLLIVTTRRIRSEALARAEAVQQAPREIAPTPSPEPESLPPEPLPPLAEMPAEPPPVVGLDPWPGQLALGAGQAGPFPFTMPVPEVEEPPPPPPPLPLELFIRRPDPPDPNVALRQRLSAAEAERDQTRGVWTRLQADAAAAGESVAGLAEMLASVRDRIDAAVRQTAQSQAAMADAAGKAERIRGQLAKTTQQIDAVRRQHAAEATRYAVLPFDGRTGTNLRPVLIELTGEGLRFLPEDIRLQPDDFDGYTEGVNPLLAGAKALITYWTEVSRRSGGTEPEPYVLLIVRPSGAHFFTARRLLARLNGPIGYELLPEDAPLALPPADPQAAAVCREAIAELLDERERLRGLLVDGAGGGRGVGLVDGPAGARGFGSFGRSGDRAGDPTGDDIEDRLGNRPGHRGGEFMPPRTASAADSAAGSATGREGGMGSPSDTGGMGRFGRGENADMRPGGGDGHGADFVPPAPAAVGSGIAAGESQPGAAEKGGASGRPLTTFVPPAPSPVGVASVDSTGDPAGTGSAGMTGPPGAEASSNTGAGDGGGDRFEPPQLAEGTGTGTTTGTGASDTGQPGRGENRPDASAVTGSQPSGGGNAGSSSDGEGNLPDFAALYLRHKLRPQENPRRRWGQSDPRASIGFERDVPVEIYPDHLIVGGTYLVRTERAREPEEVSIWMLEAIERKARSWGLPPTSFYWVPTLTFHVAPGAEPLYGRLRKTADEWSLRSSARRMEPAGSPPNSTQPTSGGTP